VALRGERFDGHDHVAAAAGAGATAVMVERPVEVPEGVGVLRVPDTLEALGRLAAHHRGRFDLPVIAVTGSVGKTSTRTLLAAALRGVGRHVLETTGNLNNLIGAPMTLLTLAEEHDAAVVEIGMNTPGEIARLTAIVAPTVGVVTAVAAAHTEGVGDLEGVAREKGALLLGLPPEGVAVHTADDAVLLPWADATPATHRLTFGVEAGATVRLLDWSIDLDERGVPCTKARYRVGMRPIALRLRLLGGGSARNVAATLATLEALGEDLETAVAALEEVAPVPGRLAPRPAPRGRLVLDDSYNASPRSVSAALKTAAALARARGTGMVAVLGDMLELGAEELAAHRTAGIRVVEAGARAFVAAGPRMSEAGRSALRQTMDGPRGQRTAVVLVRDAAGAVEAALEVARDDDVVLVKGSRSAGMEAVVEALLDEARATAPPSSMDDDEPAGHRDADGET
jgi:UDP-N-acetylmuramoyl-tripeptide--D-alanyl-D-alanine ligase